MADCGCDKKDTHVHSEGILAIAVCKCDDGECPCTTEICKCEDQKCSCTTNTITTTDKRVMPNNVQEQVFGRVISSSVSRHSSKGVSPDLSPLCKIDIRDAEIIDYLNTEQPESFSMAPTLPLTDGTYTIPIYQRVELEELSYSAEVYEVRLVSGMLYYIIREESDEYYSPEEIVGNKEAYHTPDLFTQFNIYNRREECETENYPKGMAQDALDRTFGVLLEDHNRNSNGYTLLRLFLYINSTAMFVEDSKVDKLSASINDEMLDAYRDGVSIDDTPYNLDDLLEQVEELYKVVRDNI